MLFPHVCTYIPKVVDPSFKSAEVSPSNEANPQQQPRSLWLRQWDNRLHRVHSTMAMVGPVEALIYRIEKGTVSHINASYTHCYAPGWYFIEFYIGHHHSSCYTNMFLTHRHRLLMFVRNCSGQFLVLHRPTYDRPQPTLFEQGDWVVTLAIVSPKTVEKKLCIHVYKWVYNMQLPEALGH